MGPKNKRQKQVENMIKQRSIYIYIYIYIYVCMFSIYVDITLNIYIFNNNKHCKPYYFFYYA